MIEEKELDKFLLFIYFPLEGEVPLIEIPWPFNYYYRNVINVATTD